MSPKIHITKFFCIGIREESSTPTATDVVSVRLLHSKAEAPTTLPATVIDAAKAYMASHPGWRRAAAYRGVVDEHNGKYMINISKYEIKSPNNGHWSLGAIINYFASMTDLLAARNDPQMSQINQGIDAAVESGGVFVGNIIAAAQ